MERIIEKLQSHFFPNKPFTNSSERVQGVQRLGCGCSNLTTAMQSCDLISGCDFQSKNFLPYLRKSCLHPCCLVLLALIQSSAPSFASEDFPCSHHSPLKLLNKKLLLSMAAHAPLVHHLLTLQYCCANLLSADNHHNFSKHCTLTLTLHSSNKIHVKQVSLVCGVSVC